MGGCDAEDGAVEDADLDVDCKLFVDGFWPVVPCVFVGAVAGEVVEDD